MNQKTDSTSGFAGIDRAVLLVLTAAVLALVFFSEAPQQRFGIDRGFQLTLYPWVTAAGITVEGGLDVFSGMPVTPPTDAQRASMLIGLLLGFVVGPTLLLFSWRGTKLQTTGRFRRAGLLLGGMLTYALVLPAVPTAILHWKNYEAMEEARAQGEARDEVIFGIQLILRDARQFKTLPASEEGGNGTFRGYALPVALSGNQFGNYEVETLSDSVLVIKGIPITNPSAATVATLKTDGSLSWQYRGY